MALPRIIMRKKEFWLRKLKTNRKQKFKSGYLYC